MKSDIELKGTIAYRGRVKGTVRIVLDNEDIAKVAEGDILVTDMTTPNHLPALKRAAAFVTNRGGMLCHAAVLSREYQKPCVINTKNATEVLTNGMHVEVDAETGFVRSL